MKNKLPAVAAILCIVSVCVWTDTAQMLYQSGKITADGAFDMMALVFVGNLVLAIGVAMLLGKVQKA